MTRRRSKRKSTVLEGLTKGYGGLRRSKRKLALKEDEKKIYGDDYGILPSVAASAIPGRVPLGFICGFPVPSGEQYGGSMFAKSAANDTLQGSAIQGINEKWGEGKWNGRETIGIPVCKKKYAPFVFRNEEGEIKVQRMFGCRCHSDIRKEKIEMHGLRKGWEPFGQWSMRKAQELVRQETDRASATTTIHQDAAVVSSDEDLKSMCSNGKCAWKMVAKYDNIRREVTGMESSDEEC